MKIKNLFKKNILGIAVLLLTSTTINSAYANNYIIDKEHTFAHFKYNHMGLSEQNHKFDKTEGKITFNPDFKEASVEVKIDINSINTGIPAFNNHLKSEDFFNVERFPEATFKSTDAKFKGNELKEVRGDLTIKGITKNVILEIDDFKILEKHPMTGKKTIGAMGEIEINRSDFDLGKFTPAVSDKVEIKISLEAILED